jgi:hypothetical protein
VNTAKLADLPYGWAADRYPNPDARAGYLASHDIHDLPESIAAFLQFYEARRARMAARLLNELGVQL